MLRNLPKDHEFWRCLKETVELLCWLRLQKRYAEADEERDLFLRLFGKYGMEIRMNGKHVAIGDKIGPLAWTHDK